MMRPLAMVLLLAVSACRTPENRKPLGEVVAEINTRCPVMVDSETRLENLEQEGDSILQYNYSLVNLDAAKVDTQAFRKAMWPGLLSHIRVSREMAPLKEAGVVIRYAYRDRNGSEVYLFRIGPADYNQRQAP